MPKELLPRLGGAADQFSARRHVRHYPSLRSNLCSLTNPQVASHCRLATNLDEVLQHSRTRDPNLRHNDTAAAKADIVPDLHQVIEPGAGANRRVPCGASIDGDVGANLHIIFKDHPSEVGDGKESRFGGSEAESLLPDTCPG